MSALDDRLAETLEIAGLAAMDTAWIDRDGTALAESGEALCNVKSGGMYRVRLRWIPDPGAQTRKGRWTTDGVVVADDATRTMRRLDKALTLDWSAIGANPAAILAALQARAASATGRNETITTGYALALLLEDLGEIEVNNGEVNFTS